VPWNAHSESSKPPVFFNYRPPSLKIRPVCSSPPFLLPLFSGHMLSTHGPLSPTRSHQSLTLRNASVLPGFVNLTWSYSILDGRFSSRPAPQPLKPHSADRYSAASPLFWPPSRCCQLHAASCSFKTGPRSRLMRAAAPAPSKLLAASGSLHNLMEFSDSKKGP